MWYAVTVLRNANYWSVSLTGGLPPGLSVQWYSPGAYTIYGTPTTHGTYTFSLTGKVTWESPPVEIGTYTIFISTGHLLRKAASNHLARKSSNGHLLTGTDPISVPSITTEAIPNATSGASYSVQLTATGGTTPYVWSLDSGSFPSGISLSSSGIIAGTSSATPGSFTVTVRVTDQSANFATRTFVFSLQPATSSLSFELWSNDQGSAYNIMPVYEPNVGDTHRFVAGYVNDFVDLQLDFHTSLTTPDHLQYPGVNLPTPSHYLGAILENDSNWPVSDSGGVNERVQLSGVWWHRVRWNTSRPAGSYFFWVERSVMEATHTINYQFRVRSNGVVIFDRVFTGTASYYWGRRYTPCYRFDTSSNTVTEL